jgi:16S rRNA C967 or C1407 C5-methylase (RsmB/RsmF family)
MHSSQRQDKIFNEQVEEYLISQYGNEHYSKILKQLSIPPLISSIRVNTLSPLFHNSNENISSIMEQARILLSNLLDNKYQVQIHNTVPDCLTIPVIPNEDASQRIHERSLVVVDKKCGEAVLRGSNIFAPGIIGMSAHVTVDSLVSVFANVSNTTVMKMGHKIRSIDEVSDMVFVGNGKLIMDRSVIVNKGTGTAVEMIDPLFVTPSFNHITVTHGREFFIQNLSSMIASHLLNPQPNETIIDLCGAPGGKTTHIATLMQNKGLLYTCDRHSKKVIAMQKLVDQMELSIIQPIQLDSTKASHATIKTPNGTLQFTEESFDRILLDAPCSGLGNRPTFSHEKITFKILKETAAYQRQLFVEAVKLLKIGGTLVYSTCTINPMENEENIRWALEKYNGILKLVEPDEQYLNEASSGIQSILPDQFKQVLRFCPYYNPNHIGFFAAKFEKITSYKQEE